MTALVDAPHAVSPENYNLRFPRYPEMTSDAGWVHGIWYCSTSWRKASLHGQYPPGFLDRALSLFPKAKDVLQCPSGTVNGPGITVDRVLDDVRRPRIVACAGRLPFRDGAFDLVLSDPPYSAEDSKKYGCRRFPVGAWLDEAWRVLRPDGHLAVLHVSVPQFRKAEWELRGLVAVVTGFRKATRIFSILRARKGDGAAERACHLCERRFVGRPRWWSFSKGHFEGHTAAPKERPVCSRCYRALFRFTGHEPGMPLERLRETEEYMDKHTDGWIRFA